MRQEASVYNVGLVKKTSYTSSVQKPVVALIYVRVSTAQQVEDGVSLEMQETRCRALAAARNYPVAGVFRDEGFSGDSEKREGLQQMLEQVERLRLQDIEPLIIVYEMSRLTRSPSFTLRLLGEKRKDNDCLGVKVVSLTEPEYDMSTPMGAFMHTIMAAVRKLELDQLRRRTKDGLAQAKMNGKYLGQKTAAMLAPETVAEVRKLYAQGMSVRTLADYLNSRGVPTPSGKGKKWWPRTVQICLENHAENQEDSGTAGD